MGRNEEDEVEFEDQVMESVDEEEEEEGQDEYEKDDFIVDDVEEEVDEEERADSNEERHKKKKKKKRESEDVLDEDDYELLRDNNAYHPRPKDSKKFKRLKKAHRDSGEDHFGLSDEEVDGTGKGERTAEEKLKLSLFGDDEGVALEDDAEEEPAEEEDDMAMADFIVDEEVDESGAPMRPWKLKRKKWQAPGVTTSSLQEARELFGDVNELLSRRKQQLESSEWKFNLHCPPGGEVGVDERQYKRPGRKSQYSICSKAGLWEVASKFGLSAETLGSYLSVVKIAGILENAKETLPKKHLKHRMIVHPRFQNITADEAMEFLSDKDPGESIIRPSSRGPSYLTLTLKVYDGVYAHKDIVEGGKEHKDITSLLRIGKTLKIGDDTFEDLDEVMDRYVDPLVTHLKSMLSYRKFRRGTKAEIDEQLRIEKADYPTRILYSFGISHEHPGTFILTYIRSANPHHEFVGLYPKGFKFRKRMFEDIDRLVAYFQRHTLHQSFDRVRSSGQSSRTGRKEYKNGSNRDGHQSGIPRPYGGRGHGCRGNNTGNDRQDSGFDNKNSR
ncbi:transcription elongation factor SPT6 homolog [Euphorbia lathyris]|uniref:transcription elongation factor SPT6 homolog n=1 Tax=Euphorbia lathyris TaxID=212925 RepID=UPI0033131992